MALNEAKPFGKESQVGSGRPKSKRARAALKRLNEAKYNVRTYRSRGACEVVATPDCTVRGSQFHHRKPRSHGGEHSEANGLWVCVHCHQFIHANPALSYERGWLLRGHEDETAVPLAASGRFQDSDSSSGRVGVQV